MKPKTDKSSSEILAEQEIQRLEENEAEITRLKKQMKPKTDNTSMGNPPRWVDELYRLDVGDPDSKGCTISLGEYLRTDCPELEGFISDLLSLQREQVRREVVEEVRQCVYDLIGDEAISRKEIDIGKWILDTLLSKKGEKKGNV